MNSSTYYHFFCGFTDGRHINPSDVYDFPLDVGRLDQQAIEDLGKLSTKLDRCMAKNTMQWRKSGLLIDSVDSKPCKPIIDEIDRTLARHYGFTEEEMDLVINYDIKYRLGQEGSEETEE